jgi:hypothetical protein
VVAGVSSEVTGVVVAGVASVVARIVVAGVASEVARIVVAGVASEVARIVVAGVSSVATGVVDGGVSSEVTGALSVVSGTPSPTRGGATLRRTTNARSNPSVVAIKIRFSCSSARRHKMSLTFSSFAGSTSPPAVMIQFTTATSNPST